VQQSVARDFESDDRLVTPNRGKMIEKFIQGMPALEIVDQGLRRHSSAQEDRRSAEDLGITVNDAAALGHTDCEEVELECKPKPGLLANAPA
jgi:hypothetical protein